MPEPSPAPLAPECPVPPPSLADSHYRQIISSAVDYAIITCLDNRCITTWNVGAERLTGWTAAEMIGRHIDLLYTPDDVAARIPERELAIASREGRALNERWHLRRDGSRFWASGETLPLQGETGAPASFLTILRDRTDERRQSLDMKFLARASDELAALSEVPVTLDKIAHLAVPDFADYCAVDLLEPGGVLRRVAAVHANPHRQTQVEAMHRQFPPNRRTRGGTWHVLTTGRPQLVPRVTREILERAIESGRRRDALLALGLHSYIAAPLGAQGEVLGVITFATTGDSPSGRTYGEADLSLAVDLARRAAIALQNGRLLGELRHADRAKDVFIATLAHELRNPLAPIRNGLSILQRVPGDPQRVEQVTGMIDRQVGLLSRLVDDLLDMSRISTGKLELKKQPLNLVQVLSTAVEMSRPLIEKAGHRLIQSFPQEPVQVLGDPARLAQVFSNLLNNSAKYTRPGGRVELTVTAHPAELEVRVRDNGAGIAPEMLRRVFHLFTQLPQPEDRRQGGLGIGLSLVDGLVRLHGGRVEAHSQGLGHGSEFIVRLPRYPRASALRAPATPAAAPAAAQASQVGLSVSGPASLHGDTDVAEDAGEGEAAAAGGPTAPGAPATPGVRPRPPRRVLVVDDNIDAATTVADLLAMAGIEVVHVHDGLTAVERAAEFCPDLVLLDIGLPDISGYEVARRIRRLEGIRQPVLIALTGWGQQQDKQQAAAAGFDQHWTKPVDPQRLLDLAATDSLTREALP